MKSKNSVALSLEAKCKKYNYSTKSIIAKEVLLNSHKPEEKTQCVREYSVIGKQIILTY